MSDQLWQAVARTIIGAGQIPISLTETLLELLQTIMNEEEARLVQIFTNSLNLQEIRY
jgi:hypothetical protein